MSSTQTYYFNPEDTYQPYAFYDNINKKWIYFDARQQFLWNNDGQAFINQNYPLMTSPVPELTDIEYTGYYYYMTFNKGSTQISNHSTMGSA